MVKLGGGIRILKKPSQRRRKVSGSGNNFHLEKINPVNISGKKKAIAEAMKKEAAKKMDKIRNDRNVVSRKIMNKNDEEGSK